MYRLEFTFGVGFDKDGGRISQRVEPLAIIRSVACRLFGGCTLVHGNGSWHDGTRIVEEPTYTLVADAAEYEPVHIGTLVDAIKKQLNQQSVHVASWIVDGGNF